MQTVLDELWPLIPPQFLQDLNEFQKAEEILNKAVTLEPDNPLSHFSLGWGHSDTHRHRHTQTHTDTHTHTTHTQLLDTHRIEERKNTNKDKVVTLHKLWYIIFLTSTQLSVYFRGQVCKVLYSYSLSNACQLITLQPKLFTSSFNHTLATPWQDVLFMRDFAFNMARIGNRPFPLGCNEMQYMWRHVWRKANAELESRQLHAYFPCTQSSSHLSIGCVPVYNNGEIASATAPQTWRHRFRTYFEVSREGLLALFVLLSQ